MLTTETVAVMRTWCDERQGHSDDTLFPTRQGRALTPKAVAWLLDKHVATAAAACPSLTGKRVTPHVYADPIAKPTRVDGDVPQIAGLAARERSA